MVLAALIFIIVIIYYLGRKRSKRDEAEPPAGPVSLESPFYIERPPVESDSYNTIAELGALIRIKAPRQMGKTSLMMLILHHAQQQGYRTVSLSFDQVDSTALARLDLFLHWFCTSVTRKLNLSADKVDLHWDKSLDGLANCNDYFENGLLAETNRPLVLGLDKVDRVFEHSRQRFF